MQRIPLNDRKNYTCDFCNSRKPAKYLVKVLDPCSKGGLSTVPCCNHCAWLLGKRTEVLA